MNILTVNLLLSTFVFWIAARLYLLPRLHACEPRDVLLPILLLHALRHLGLMFLAPGAVYPGIPAQFAVPAALGDLLAAVLAVIAIPAVATRARSAQALVWLFNLAARSIFPPRSRSPPCTTQRRSWDRRTGSPRSGCRPCWSPTTSCSAFCSRRGPRRRKRGRTASACVGAQRSGASTMWGAFSRDDEDAGILAL